MGGLFQAIRVLEHSGDLIRFIADWFLKLFLGGKVLPLLLRMTSELQNNLQLAWATYFVGGVVLKCRRLSGLALVDAGVAGAQRHVLGCRQS
jgi:hypothetical protein